MPSTRGSLPDCSSSPQRPHRSPGRSLRRGHTPRRRTSRRSRVRGNLRSGRRLAVASAWEERVPAALCGAASWIGPAVICVCRPLHRHHRVPARLHCRRQSVPRAHRRMRRCATAQLVTGPAAAGRRATSVRRRPLLCNLPVALASESPSSTKAARSRSTLGWRCSLPPSCCRSSATAASRTRFAARWAPFLWPVSVGAVVMVATLAIQASDAESLHLANAAASVGA